VEVFALMPHPLLTVKFIIPQLTEDIKRKPPYWRLKVWREDLDIISVNDRNIKAW